MEEMFCSTHVMSLVYVTFCGGMSLHLLISNFMMVSLFAGLEQWNELWNGLRKTSKIIFHSNTWLCCVLILAY